MRDLMDALDVGAEDMSNRMWGSDFYPLVNFSIDPKGEDMITRRLRSMAALIIMCAGNNEAEISTPTCNNLITVGAIDNKDAKMKEPNFGVGVDLDGGTSCATPSQWESRMKLTDHFNRTIVFCNLKLVLIIPKNCLFLLKTIESNLQYYFFL